MQSLPTPVKTADLNTLLDALALMPSAKVNRYFGAVTVTATKKTTGEKIEVLRATEQPGNKWHVMTVPGIITVKANA